MSKGFGSGQHGSGMGWAVTKWALACLAIALIAAASGCGLDAVTDRIECGRHMQHCMPTGANKWMRNQKRQPHRGRQ